jgi:3-oxoadipate enol-lactonase
MMMKFFKVGQTKIAYDEAGDGLPLIFIHGFPLNHHLWEPQFSGLQDVAWLIAPDLPGHGESDSRQGSYLMEQVAADVNYLLDALDIQKQVLLCGLSLGGYMIGHFFQNYGGRLAGLIFTATRASADSPEAKLNRDRLLAIARTEGVEQLVEAVLPKFLAPSAYQTRPELVEQVRQIMRSTSLEGVVGDLSGMRARPDTFDLIREIRLPTLVIHGEEDQLIPLNEAERIRDCIPGARLITIPAAGHLPNLEQPDLFNRAIKEFIPLVSTSLTSVSSL